jgi:hypothetical protein
VRWCGITLYNLDIIFKIKNKKQEKENPEAT